MLDEKRAIQRVCLFFLGAGQKINSLVMRITRFSQASRNSFVKLETSVFIHTVIHKT